MMTQRLMGPAHFIFADPHFTFWRCDFVLRLIHTQKPMFDANPVHAIAPDSGRMHSISART